MKHPAWISLYQEASEARNFLELRELRHRAHDTFLGHLSMESPLTWNEEVNRFHDLVIGRVLAMTEHGLCAELDEPVPLPYAFLLFGSGGRREQTLWSDQDNGILYEDTQDEELRGRARSFFEALAGRISANLEAVGYPPCSGGVLCTSPRWRQPFSGYRRMLDNWLADPDWEHVRYLLIAADLRVLHGARHLGDRLLERLVGFIQEHPAMYAHIQRNTLRHKVSIGIFGQLIKERYGEDAGGVDVKYGAYIPIVNGIRLLALEAGISVTSTEERIRLLIAGGHVQGEIGQDWLDALAIVLKLRSTTSFQLQDGRYSSRGILTPDLLTPSRTKELKHCLRVAGELQKFVKKTILHERELENGKRQSGLE
ncbi:DUF294 nucleotidyltransferase-like domain-containing protein [Paenibacillus puerhi]|uniref:DUF294 nucleotidyltransferase-like domain-containing protein n=1 Tax=Paenibacillus puerhi TaxID=2692622 RepID=UPI0013575ED1|nr:DUF294 nucleotidyltransferase-like domain-containing protein [Paenibacillus puerhi]